MHRFVWFALTLLALVAALIPGPVGARGAPHLAAEPTAPAPVLRVGDAAGIRSVPALLIGTDAAHHETDKRIGRRARYFERGVSRHEVVFHRPGE